MEGLKSTLIITSRPVAWDALLTELDRIATMAEGTPASTLMEINRRAGEAIAIARALRDGEDGPAWSELGRRLGPSGTEAS